MKIIIFDFEVFMYDVLLGAIVIDNSSEHLVQTWDIDEIKDFYYENENSVWIGHNNLCYDNQILNAIVNNNKNIYKLSKSLIGSEIRRRSKIPRITYDTMKTKGFYSLKMTELVVGKKISTSDVDFNIDRPLTDEERRLTEKYNQDDLHQTRYNFNALYYDFELRVNLMNEFHLNWNTLTMTESQIAAKVLNAHQVPGIENQEIKPKIYDTLQVKNKNVLDFYLNEKYRNKCRLKEVFCGCDHYLAAGGIHGALKKQRFQKALYFDVSGYYNLVMLLYDLLPRTMSESSKELYRSMYFEQLKMKGIPELKKRRIAYKTILLAVFGSMLNEHTDFYDPAKGRLVTVTGEMFLVDLLEKLEGKAKVIQSNTDGIIALPNDWNNVDEIIQIIRDWEHRTGFTIEIDEISNIWQRDVNNYCYIKNNKPNVRGEAVGGYFQIDNPVADQIWSLKEAHIISVGIVNYLLFNVLPEETIEKAKRNLLSLQFIAKKNSYDYLSYNDEKLEYGMNRVFPLKKELGVGCIVKAKVTNDKVQISKIAGLPENCFIYNDEILTDEGINNVVEKIDYQFYINRIYARIGEFIDIESVKKLCIK